MARPDRSQQLISFFAVAIFSLNAGPTPAEAADVPANGWVVWASDRKDSRHEIYLMKADGSGVKRLTFKGGEFPAWSPDGKWIAYTATDSSTHVMRWTGNDDKKVCDGKLEFWMWNGSGLVCRVSDDHYLVNPDTGSKKLLFKKSDFSKIGSKDLNPGGITHDGKYLLAHSDIYRNGYTGDNGTFKAYHAAVILDLTNKGKIYYFGSGCEPTTPPSGNLIYHVCGDCPTKPDPYKMSVSDISTRSSYTAEIAHADADWGHEYFPRISNDNQWMVYGATTGCHDHDTCDYEIFVHRLGAGNSNRTRITNDPKNDQWPHLFVGTLPTFGCSTDSDCDDSDPCTADTCSGGKCTNSPLNGCCTADGDCADSDPCTKDTCSGNKCVHSSISGCCTSDGQCDDGDSCTTDTCSGNACQHAPISGCCSIAADCDDSNPCTNDTCSSNKCSHGSISGCCTKDSQCDDSNPCTGDTCSGNTCSHAAISGCCTQDADCKDSNPCTNDTCDTSTGSCDNAKVTGCCAVDTDCDDSKVCTLDTCVNNACQHSAISGCCTSNSQCGDSNPCTEDSCVGNSCKNTKISGCCTKNSQCGDGDPCTSDQCKSNSCTHVAITGCCTKDSQCDDTNLCTTDTCSSSSCQHQPISGCCSVDSDCTDNNPCTQNSCDTATGNCSGIMITGCCAYDTDCDDLDPCTVDSCDPVSNSCSFFPSGDCSDAGIQGGDGGMGSDSGTGANVNAIDEHTLEGGCVLVLTPTHGATPWLLVSIGLLLLVLLGGRRRDH